MKRPKLLCVGLDSRTRVSYERAFRRGGYDVLLASRPSKALRAFHSPVNNIDVVICSYDLPGMTGAELAAELKRANPRVHVIMFSGSQAMLEEASHFVDAAVPQGAAPELVISKLDRLFGTRDSDLISTHRYIPVTSAIAGIVVAGLFVSKLWE